MSILHIISSIAELTLLAIVITGVIKFGLVVKMRYRDISSDEKD